MKKSNFKTIAEAIQSGQLSEVDLPTENLDMRTLTSEEVSKIVKEEFGKAKDANKVKAKEAHFQDAELAKHIDWIKALKLESFFDKK